MAEVIKGLVLDVDGVIIGSRTGINMPLPSKRVAQALRKVNERGIPVCLCTAKSSFSVARLALFLRLDSPHSGDNGAVVLNPVKGITYKVRRISPKIAESLAVAFSASPFPVEVYSPQDYYVKKAQANEHTKIHEKILEKPSVKVDGFSGNMPDNVVKMLVVAPSEKHKEEVEGIFEPFRSELELKWSFHPLGLPARYAIITSRGVSKALAARDFSRISGVPLKNFLAVGDAASDWDFMKLCGYAASMGEESKELIERVYALGEKGYNARGVDSDGLIGVLGHFGLM